RHRDLGAGGRHRLRRSARHPADDPRDPARRLPTRRIPAPARHDRHGRAAVGARRDRRTGARSAVPASGRRAARPDRHGDTRRPCRGCPGRGGILRGSGRERTRRRDRRRRRGTGRRATQLSHPDAILARLLRLHPKLIDLSLGRIERLLAGLGDPHRHLPPVIHVAGTNGKGSTVAFLRAMLEAAGKTVHTYTSPHLVRFNERISVAGRDVDDEALSALLLECEEANRGEPITFFEITTAAALLAFARTPADVALLEVGLGGRLDATNVVERPAVCAITPIGLDHQQYLGDTLTQIAGEKAGILKAGVPAVIAPQPPEAARAID